MKSKLNNLKCTILSIIVCSFFMCACGTAGTYENGFDDASQKNNNNYIYDDSKLQYNTAAELTIGDTGYYYVYNNTLYFYDVSENAEGVVCSKLECKHDSSGCAAFVQRESRGVTDGEGNPVDRYDTEKGTNCIGHMIFYHNKKLYMIERNDNGDYLVEYDQRFNNKRTVTKLTDSGSVVGCVEQGNMTDTAFMAGEYLYYMSVAPDSDVAKNEFMAQVGCYRVRIADDAKPEKIGEFDRAVDEITWGSKSSAKVVGVGDKVYFITSLNTRFMINENSAQYRIGMYDCSKGTFSMILNINANNATDALGEGTGEAILYNSCIDENNNIYFVSHSESGSCMILKMSLDSFKIDKIKTLDGNMTSVKNMIYNNGRLYAYAEYSDGSEGKLFIHSIDLSDNHTKKFEIEKALKWNNSKLLAVDDYYLIINNGEKVIMRQNDLWN